MKLCVPVPCFFPHEDFPEAVRKTAGLGYRAVETYDWSKLDLPACGQACREYGVAFLSMCTSEFRMTDTAYRQAWLEGLEMSCQAANTAGVGRLITQVGPDTGKGREVQKEAIAETLLQARPILDKYGVTVMVEPLNTYVDHPGYFLTRSGDGFDIIRAVNHPRVKLIYDIYHQQIMEGNIIPSITKNLDLIAHLHAAGHPGRHELQRGESDYKNIFQAVDQAGYEGWCGLEYTPTMDPMESLKIAREIYG